MSKNSGPRQPTREQIDAFAAKHGADAAFFYEHAGVSWMPGKETQEQGRERGAIENAAAESWARNAGYSFSWMIDPHADSSEFKKGKPYSLWECVCHRSDGEIDNSLGGIDFGRDGQPWGDSYKRVVEAQLAIEAKGNPPC